MKIIKDKHLIFDGIENDFFKAPIISDYTYPSLNKLNHEAIGELGNGMLVIAEKLGLVEGAVEGLYVSTPEGLSILIKAIYNKLHFFSAGETQPGRYKIYSLGYIYLL